MKKYLIYLKSLFTIILFFCSFYFAYIPIWLFKIDAENMSDTTSVLLTMFSNFVLVIILVLVHYKDLKREWKNLKENPTEKIDTGFKYWFIGLVIMVVSNIIINVFFVHDIAINEQGIQKMIKVSPWIMLFNAGILAPITEEITFRKTFRDCIKNKWIYIFTSGIIFGLLHVVQSNSLVEFLYVIPYSSLGIAFAALYHKTDSVFVPMFMHFFHNTMLTLISILPTLF